MFSYKCEYSIVWKWFIKYLFRGYIIHHSGLTDKITTFRQNSTLFINIVSFYSDTLIPTLLWQFDAFFVERFVFGLKIRRSFFISLLHWSQISLPGAFFWCLQTASSRWGPDQENRMGAEAIQGAIHGVLPSLRSTCDTGHCLGERALFSSLFVAAGWGFLPSNAPIMLYNISYGWFFLSQGNRWTKYLAHPKILRPKPCLLMFASFGRFGQLSPAAIHLADSRFVSGVKWWIHVPSIDTYIRKNSFLWRWNSCKQRSKSFLFLINCDQTLHPIWTQLSPWQMLMQNGEYTAFW